MSWYALDVLDDALDETKALLLPFDLWLWVKLAVITFFVGAGGQPTMSFQFNDGMTSMGGMPADPGRFGALVVLIAVAAALLGVTFAIVGSVMEFVLVDVVRSRNVRIRDPFSRHLSKGLRLFGFRLALALVLLAALLVFAAPLIVGGLLGGAGVVMVLLSLLLLPVFLVGCLVVALVYEFTTAFVVPLMLETDRGLLDTWRVLYPEARADWKQFGVYAVVRLGLAILVGMILGVIGGILFLPIIAGFGFVMLTGGMPSAFVLVVLGLVFLAIVALLAIFVQMPVTTYLRYHSLLTLDESNVEFTLRSASGEAR